jgi:hypothetical protein
MDLNLGEIVCGAGLSVWASSAINLIFRTILTQSLT